jgi:hypothetical protein
MNDMRKLMEAVQLDESSKDWRAYSMLVKKYKIEPSIPSPDYWGVSWVDQHGKERYEEMGADEVNSPRELIHFALSEMGM